MSDTTLTFALGNYGHTTPLKDGSVTSSRFGMEHKEITPVPMIFRRMVRALEFDVAEMALATYLCSRAHGKRFTALPIFLTHDF
ncbi:MAG: ABC transporter substrate-binding protein, partial [Chloroflexi bacterium]|nr:ABC transporter substrate-binding protein [Chloroflexota bacterium]